MKNRIFLNPNPGTVKAVYSGLFERLDCEPGFFKKEDVLADPEKFRDVTEIFSTWGMPRFTEEEIARCFPNLKCVYYGAGSVQGFAFEFLQSGVRVFSAWAANAVPVAEFTVAEIVLCMKGFFHTVRQYSAGDLAGSGANRGRSIGNYDYKVGILGAGMVGREVIRLLKNYECEILVFDPFLPDEKAAALGVKKASLDEIFASCEVVSNHLANNARTRGMLRGAHFEKMMQNCFFINTGRGAQIVESEMTDVLAARPDLTVFLDVTDPEPPVAGSPLYSLPNVVMTPHIAGSLGREVKRMGVYMTEESERVAAGEPAKWEVSLEMLKTMA